MPHWTFLILDHWHHLAVCWIPFCHHFVWQLRIYLWLLETKCMFLRPFLESLFTILRQYNSFEWHRPDQMILLVTGLPHTDSHSTEEMEIKPGIAEMIREEERVSYDPQIAFVCHCSVFLVARLPVYSLHDASRIIKGNRFIWHSSANRLQIQRANLV